MFAGIKTPRLGELWPVATFAILLGLLVILKGRFTAFDLRTLCVNVLPLTLIAMGQFFVVLTRGIDLSLGPVSSVAGATAALLLSHSIVVGLAAPIAVGVVAGLFNALLVVNFGLSPIIVTLATMSIWQGVALVILPNPGGEIPSNLAGLIVSGGLAPPALVLIIAVIVGGGWVMSTRFGLHLRAIGDDPAAAGMSGVRVARVKQAAYILAGALAALSGVAMAVATSTGSPTVGDDYILLSVATVVVGGVPLAGGRGTALGVVMGALTLTLIGSLLYFANLSSFYQSIINGVILLAVVASGKARLWLWDLAKGSALRR